MKEFLIVIITVFGMVAVFASLRFTPAVYPENVERAEQMCKNGEWVKIDNAYITCKDGAQYSRKGE